MTIPIVTNISHSMNPMEPVLKRNALLITLCEWTSCLFRKGQIPRIFFSSMVSEHSIDLPRIPHKIHLPLQTTSHIMLYECDHDIHNRRVPNKYARIRLLKINRDNAKGNDHTTIIQQTKSIKLFVCLWTKRETKKNNNHKPSAYTHVHANDAND